MPLIGIIEISVTILQDEEVCNLLLDNFTIIEQKEDERRNVITLMCCSDYFNEIEEGDVIPCYHVDLNRDKQTNELYIWRVQQAD